MRNDDIAVALAAIPLELERVRAELTAGLLLTKDAVTLQGAEARALVDGGGNGRRVATTSGRLVGFNLHETSGTTRAEVRLLDGEDGEALALISLEPGESARDWYGPGGVSFIYGLYAQIVTGAIEGIAYIGAVD